MRAPRRTCSRASSCWSSCLLSRSPLGCPLARRLHRPQEISLPDLDAVMTQQCIGHGLVEKEIRQYEIVEVRETGEIERAILPLDLDRASLGAVELLGRHAL